MIINEEKRHQIMSYIVHAWEILKKDNHFPKYSYKYAYLPTWSELYTWVLKAAGYLFLERNLENIVFVVKQTEYPDEIIFYNEKDSFLIWWNNIENKNIFNSKIQKPIPKELFEQLLYVRLLTKINTTTIIWIWKKYNTEQFIKQIPVTAWIVFLGKMSIDKSIKISKEENKKMIESVLFQKEYKKDTKRIGNLYIKIAKKYKKKSELIVYIHSSELWIKVEHQTGYSCIVS